MICGLGCDAVEIRRIQRALERQPQFYRAVLSESEQAVYLERNKLSEARGLRYLASRWAAKEAFSKARGTGFRGNIRFADISVLNNELGAPYLFFEGALAEEIRKESVSFLISLSDTDTAAFAVVVCEKLSRKTE